MVKMAMKKTAKKAAKASTKAAPAPSTTAPAVAPEKPTPTSIAVPDVKKLHVPELSTASDADEDVLASSDDESDSEDAKQVSAAIANTLGQPQHPLSKNNPENRSGLKKKSKSAPLSNEEKQQRGVLYVGHIPVGFCEPQLKSFFEQFGEVTRLRLSRSIKTGRPKGYAFLEFGTKDVAQIVAKTMNNYLLYGKKLEVSLLPWEKQKLNLFKNWKGKIHVQGRRDLKKAKLQMNNRVVKKAGEKDIVVVTQRQVKRRANTAEKKKATLKALGIEYDFSGAKAAPVEKAVVVEKAGAKEVDETAEVVAKKETAVGVGAKKMKKKKAAKKA